MCRYGYLLRYIRITHSLLLLITVSLATCMADAFRRCPRDPFPNPAVQLITHVVRSVTYFNRASRNGTLAVWKSHAHD
ncbi:hypothetical protein F5Y09DRAFT_297186 [Xylaria sp. FL1042]|nr:hypothetical protein F5Y09DRAFT_297186 [Xylaria sp. FL1042]